ncbi:MAG TPA: hypothetical protein VF334_13955, partial [Polyangia bacterium]
EPSMKTLVATMALLGGAALALAGCKDNNGAADGGSKSGMTMMLTGLGAPATTSMPQTVHLAVFNKDKTPATTYTGTVTFTSTDTVAYLPAQSTFTAADAGGHDFLTTINTAGMQSLTSTDTADAGLTATDSTTVEGPAYYYVPPTAGKIQLVPNVAQSTPTLAVLDLTAMVDLTGYFVGFDVAIDATKVAPDASLMTAGTVLNPGSNPAAIGGAIPSAGPLANALVTGISQKATGNGAVASDATIATGSVFYTVKLPLKSGAAGGTIFDGTVAKNKIRASLRNKVGVEQVGVADFGIGQLIYTP